jgi:hypothetical protein
VHNDAANRLNECVMQQEGPRCFHSLREILHLSPRSLLSIKLKLDYLARAGLFVPESLKLGLGSRKLTLLQIGHPCGLLLCSNFLSVYNSLLISFVYDCLFERLSSSLQFSLKSRLLINLTLLLFSQLDFCCINVNLHAKESFILGNSRQSCSLSTIFHYFDHFVQLVLELKDFSCSFVIFRLISFNQLQQF